MRSPLLRKDNFMCEQCKHESVLETRTSRSWTNCQCSACRVRVLAKGNKACVDSSLTLEQQQPASGGRNSGKPLAGAEQGEEGMRLDVQARKAQHPKKTREYCPRHPTVSHQLISVGFRLHIPKKAALGTTFGNVNT